MNISVFLSYSRPYTEAQKSFKEGVSKYLDDYLGFSARTLGDTDYDPDEPLTACRRLMVECNGLITLAFRRYYLEKGFEYADNSNQGQLDDKKTKKPIEPKPLNEIYFTSPWCQIEAAMAFSLGLPILVLRERGVSPRGLMKKGISGIYLPEFDLDKGGENYLETQEWKEISNEWSGLVRAVRRAKGYPHRVY
ncbi:MAG: hypothetical protein IJR72_02710 [Oscillospiraceae bacterium]|nr:hypothetical protein [Oscillospiraceae bacterium]